ncbi:hypothetical protein TNCV_2597671 [Trichonephila clavipes]|nr:hypothetical protein TNCV_2597671 [Trichonephila clavipes]
MAPRGHSCELIIAESRPFTGEKFKSGLMIVDLQMIGSLVWRSPQPLSLVSPQINYWIGCSTDSDIVLKRSSQFLDPLGCDCPRNLFHLCSKKEKKLSSSSSEPTL